MIYLNNAATTFPKPGAVAQAMTNALNSFAVSPGRSSLPDGEAYRIVWSIREKCAALFDIADPTRICFGMNATDAINTALQGYLQPGDHVVTSSMEHHAVSRTLNYLTQLGVRRTVVKTDDDGYLNVRDVERALQPDTRLLIVNHGSNVTGIVQPIDEIANLARSCSVPMMLDVSQTAGAVEISAGKWDLALLAFTGHKGLYGPQGTGGLYVAPGINVRPLRFGGTGSMSDNDDQPLFYPDHLESGTPNVPGLAGLGAGIDFVRGIGVTAINRHEQQLIQYLYEGLRKIRGVNCYGFHKNSNEHLGVLSFRINGLDCGEVATTLYQDYHIIVRSGLHCAPWAHRSIGTLQSGTVRVSVSWFTTQTDIEAMIDATAQISRRN